jgi:hypothetical protein
MSCYLLGSAQRVLFATMAKWDGGGVRPLQPSEVQQIGGRAGRFGFHDAGEVGYMGDSWCHSGGPKVTPCLWPAAFMLTSPCVSPCPGRSP